MVVGSNPTLRALSEIKNDYIIGNHFFDIFLAIGYNRREFLVFGDLIGVSYTGSTRQWGGCRRGSIPRTPIKWLKFNNNLKK